MSSVPSKQRPGRGGGRGSSSSKGRSNNNVTSNNNSNNNNNNNRNRTRRRDPNRQKSRVADELKDEDVLIAFMPYLKGSHSEATRIHEEYQSGNDQKAFLKAARAFLQREKEKNPSSTQSSEQSYSPPPPSSSKSLNENPMSYKDAFQQSSVNNAAASNPNPGNNQSNILNHQHHPASPPRPNDLIHSDDKTSNGVGGIEHGIAALMSKDDDPIVPIGFAPKGNSIWGTAPGPSPITPPRPRSENGNNGTSTPIASPWGNNTAPGPPRPILPPQPQQQLPAQPQQQLPAQPQQQLPRPPPQQQQSLQENSEVETKTAPPPSTSESPASPARAATNNTAPKKEPFVPRRLWTHFEEQPGRILVNGVAGEDLSICLPFAPREELTAEWSLPIDYLRKHQADVDPINSSLDRALHGLTVGLFRRGCTENGQQASIISKEISGYEYWHDPHSQCIRGKVPFFSPRTPGNVLFRMYWEKDPLHTLGMGPTLHVRVTEEDFEGSVRFILSNFRGRKANPTSLSSLHSLAAVLETPVTRRHEATARAVWGCIQESRKVIDACYQEYVKTSSRMCQLEERVEELKKQVADEHDTKSQELSVGTGEIDLDGDISTKTEAEAELHEKLRAFMSGRASCERKWRDSQLAFASILKAALTNQTMTTFLRRDWITRMRVEFELWCPLSEEFAVPSDESETWLECINDLPQSVTGEHFRTFQQARVKMQMRTLGFDVNTMSLEDVLFPRSRGNVNQRSMDPGAVNVFNNISAAMGQYYQDLFVNEEQVVRRREMIRQRTEQAVRECGVFAPGTEVVIFGSSANGFGSPKSDLDMCLHLPSGVKMDEEDATGSGAMAKLAEHFEKAGMKEVDTARLTARIPIIMYSCPDPISGGDAGEELVECDLSMHNPLAVLNTSLLRSYAEITPVTRVLASIIKRWAKARDINNPARHTLSSYGYIIMLLHFLTYHKRAGNGLMAPVAPPEGDPRLRKHLIPQATPLLPNLQWIDQSWLAMPKGTPYRELPSLPRTMLQHPMKDDTSVNTYFYKPNTPNEKALLQMLFPGQDLSLAILLASFFRYFAYEFDYKRHVVSLHSTAARGVVEREVKAELDGWRNYSAALAIEDPFELDYDVAHVLRGGYYHRIRREFALAYTKIADVASGRPNSWDKGDLRSMTGKELIDWICEPISVEKEQPSP